VSPTTSTLNFPTGDNRATGVTAPLGSGGVIWITYVGSVGGATTDLLFDVTGYYVPTSAGATYVSLAPARILDTRANTGLPGPFTSGSPRSLAVTGIAGVPSTRDRGDRHPDRDEPDQPRLREPHHGLHREPHHVHPQLSTGDNRATGVTAPLGSGGVIWITYVGSVGGATTDLLFDVTGYYVP